MHIDSSYDGIGIALCGIVFRKTHGIHTLVGQLSPLPHGQTVTCIFPGKTVPLQQGQSLTVPVGKLFFALVIPLFILRHL